MNKCMFFGITVDEVVEKIKDGSLSKYKYDTKEVSLVRLYYSTV